MRDGSLLLGSILASLCTVVACGHSDSQGAAADVGGSNALASGGTTVVANAPTGGVPASGDTTTSAGTGNSAGTLADDFDTSVAGGSSRDIKDTGGKPATGGTSSVAGGNAATGGALTAVTLTGGGSSRDIANTGGKPATGGTSSVTVTGGGSSRDIVDTGGKPATGGMPSTGGTSTVTTEQPTAVDVLFMIDNSASMADKQGVLATSLPSLLGRLAQPNCLDSAGKVVGKTDLDGTCAQGKAQFRPARDLHIGIITSSLGDHGAASFCVPGAPTPYSSADGSIINTPDDVNDASHLMGALPRGAMALGADPMVKASANVKLDPLGFLAWGSANQSPTTGDIASAQNAFADMVEAVAERGCGFESQLESWFRFLIDPVPPIYPINKGDDQQTHRVGTDDALLAQRAAFLRPNSMVVVVMLTDENDCSLRDTDVGWVAADTKRSLTTGSPACSTTPNDPCCFSCTATPPAGCEACASPAPTAPDDSAYQANLRCWQQKRRFGYTFLYPTSRYVVGLTKPELCPDQSFGDMDCDCTYAKSIGASCSPGARRMPNPLYSNVVGSNNAGGTVTSPYQGAPRVDNANVFLAGIIGVPWEDVGYADENGKLTYLPVTDPAWKGQSNSSVGPATPAPNGIWNLIYGNDDSNTLPGDIHMVESNVPRAGLPEPTAAAGADPITGHEWNTAYQDLEYACIFSLPSPKPCACNSGDANYASCKYQHPNDCCDLSFATDGRSNPNSAGSFNKPLCQTQTQVAAKAYPALREIAVLRDYALGMANSSPAALGNSVVTSICPKDMSGDASSAGFGYNPATDAIVSRLAERLPKD